MNVFSVEPIEDRDIDHILEMCMALFTEAVGHEYHDYFFYFMSDFSISRKAVLDGKIIGCYLLNEDSIFGNDINFKEDMDTYKSGKPLQGVALGIFREYRGLYLWPSVKRFSTSDDTIRLYLGITGQEPEQPQQLAQKRKKVGWRN